MLYSRKSQFIWKQITFFYVKDCYKIDIKIKGGFSHEIQGGFLYQTYVSYVTSVPTRLLVNFRC